MRLRRLWFFLAVLVVGLANRATSQEPEARPLQGRARSSDGVPTEGAKAATLDTSQTVSGPSHVLYPGQYVRITRLVDGNEQRVQGTVLGVRAHAVLVHLDEKVQGYRSHVVQQPVTCEVPFADIAQLEVGLHRGTHTATGMLVGFTAGAVVGGAIGYASSSEPDPSDFIRIHTRGPNTFFGGLVGGLLGMLLGAGIGSSQQRVTWAPILQEDLLQVQGSLEMPLRLGVRMGY